MNAITPAPSFPPNPTVGQVFLNWVWNGSMWVCRSTGPVNIIKTLTTSQTYWPSPGLTFAVVECIGGGGGGGPVNAVNATMMITGGGGGSGGYSKSSLSAALLINGVQVTIGAGGAAEASGGATSFGALVVAEGGGGGTGNNAGVGANQWGQGGLRAVRGVGDLTFPGSPGMSGFLSDTPLVLAIDGGIGGALFGGNATLGLGPGGISPGLPGDPNTGAGGSGAIQNQVAPAGTILGGPGGSGVCVVSEWCFGNTSLVQDCGCVPCPPPGDPCAPCPPGGWWTPSW